MTAKEPKKNVGRNEPKKAIKRANHFCPGQLRWPGGGGQVARHPGAGRECAVSQQQHGIRRNKSKATATTNYIFFFFAFFLFWQKGSVWGAHVIVHSVICI